MADERVRKAVSLLVKLSYPGLDEFVEKYATNVSTGGMFVRMREPKAVGTLLNFKVELANGQRVLQGTASVQWARGPNDPAGPAGMGIQFIKLDDSSRALVDRMVQGAPASAATPPIPRPAAAPPQAPPLELTLDAELAVPSPLPAPEPPALELDVELAAPPPARAAPLELDIDVPAPPAPAPAGYSFDADEPLDFGKPNPSKEVDVPLADLVEGTPEPPVSGDAGVLEGQLLPDDAITGEPLEGAPIESMGSNIFAGIDLEVEAPPPATLLSPAAAAPPPPPAPPPTIQAPVSPPPAAPPPPAEDALRALPEIRRGQPAPAQAPRGPEQLRPAAPPPTRKPLGAPVFIKPPDAIVGEGPIIGIDLGTTNSCVAIFANGKPRVLRSKDGYNTIPSVVALNQRGIVMVGHRAKSQLVLNPQTTIYGAKRLVGRDFDSPTVKMVRERFRYEVVPGPDGKAAVALGNHVLSLEEVQGLVLKEMKDFAEEYLNQKVTRAVVTCPAYYSEQQREAVRRAGAMAGLKVERVLNEPTAAALAYGLHRELAKRVLVYDLGGGTFDATLLRIDKNVFEVLATGGDVFLGGLDFDNLVVDLLLQKFQAQHNTEFGGDPVALSRVTEVAEKAKQSLSETVTYDIHLPMLQMSSDGRPLDLKCTVTRDEVNTVSQPLVDRTIDVVNDVLLDAKLKPTEVDDIILVGGMTRMPLVRKAIEKWFRKTPQASVNADEAVAVGAALYSGTLDKVSSVTLIDVVPMTIGVGVGGGAFKRVIERNTALPASKQFAVSTSRDNEEFIEINVFQGEDSNVTANEYVGTARIEGLPRGKKGDVQVIVTFLLDAECVLKVDAKEMKTRKSFTATLATRYTSEEIRQKLGVTQATPSVAEQRRAEELAARGGNFWGRLKRAFGFGKK